MLEKINSKKERFVSAHSFRGFSPWSLGSIASVWSWQRTCSAGKLHTSWQLGTQRGKRERERERERERDCLLLKNKKAFCHPPPQNPLSCESTNRFIHV
jgi:hypothetical protein